MKYSICSISFRHELVSLLELVRFAGDSGFAGIELWGVHGLAALRQRPLDIPLLTEEMDRRGIGISMISHYADLNADAAGFPAVEKHWQELIELARAFRTDKIRIFAGNRGSRECGVRDWETVALRLRLLADRAAQHGIRTLIETHPRTYADRLESAIRLIRDADHPGIGINLDFLHLWESGTSPEEAWRSLRPFVLHAHLKNVLRADGGHVFAPENVYAPSGSRSGMVPLAEGAVDYRRVLPLMQAACPDVQASLEWFGRDPFHYLSQELLWLESVRASPGSSKLSPSL
ncbi:sugar phosphate isomerase/epimerase family protein [Cohnella cellulosilytica]|uniref:Sugar phosphate isomerase/epimerase family protein n=1 Tax=Cohnella cellulosilytica TaxID=986710 RepID=A0ABW2F8B0_9BACL